MIYAVKSENGEGKLKKVVNNHKTTPTPRKAHYITMYWKVRELDSHIRLKLFDDIEAEARVPEIHSSLALQKKRFLKHGYLQKRLAY